MPLEELTLLVAGLYGFTEIKTDVRGIHGLINGMRCVEVCDFTQDLNAMERAEKVVLKDGEAWSKYYDILDKIAEERGVDARSASARMRAEALVFSVSETDSGNVGV